MKISFGAAGKPGFAKCLRRRGLGDGKLLTTLAGHERSLTKIRQAGK
jgi:hypothetical protein